MAGEDGSVVIKIDGDDSDFQSKLSKLASVGKTALAALGAAAGAALAGIGAYSIKVGADFEAGMSKVQAISGASGAELEQLTAKAKEMGATTKFSATESAEALQYMAMAGWKTEQMTAGLPGIMNLAAASGESLASVSDIVTDALTAFGMKAEDSAHFADVLAVASSNSNTNVAMMGETFKYVAPVAGSLGYSVEDTAVAIGLMANSGIKAEMAGTALRGMLTNLAKPTKMTAKYIDDLGLSLTDSSGQMKPLSELIDELRDKFAGLTEEQKAEYAAGVAGKEAMSGLLAIVNAAPEDYEKLKSAIGNANGAAQAQADIMNNNLKGALTLLGSNIEGVGIQIYEGLETPLKDAVKSANDSVSKISRSLSSGQLKSSLDKLAKALGNLIKGVADFAAKAIPKLIDGFARIVDHSDKLVNMLKAAAVAFAALQIASTASAALKAFHAISVSVTQALAAETAALTTKQLVVGVLTGKIGLATAAQSMWNAAMTANPIGLVVMAIGALVAGIALLVGASKEEITETDRKIQKYKELQSEYDAQQEEIDRLADARSESITLADSEINSLEHYVVSLGQCKEKNGEVKKGYEERAAYLTEEINKIIPDAIQMNEDEAGSYIKISESIKEMIAQKKRDSYISLYQAEYENALKNVNQALLDKQRTESEAEKTTRELAEAQGVLTEAEAKCNDERTRFGVASLETQDAYGAAQEDVRKLTEANQEALSAQEKANNAYEQYTDIITNMNSLKMADDIEDIDEATAKLANSVSRLTDNTDNSFEAMQQKYQDLSSARQELLNKLRDPSIPQAQRDMLVDLLKTTQSGLEGLAEQYKESGHTLSDTMIDSLNKSKAEVQEACYGAGQEVAEGYASGVESLKGDAATQAAQIKEMCQMALEGDTSVHGTRFMQGFLESILASNPAPEVEAKAKEALNALLSTIDNGQPDVEAIVRLLAQGILTEADVSIAMQGIGQNIVAGLASGIEKKKGEAIQAAANMMSSLVAKAASVVDTHSPSRVFRNKIGAMIAAGLALGIQDGEPEVIDAITKISELAIEVARDEATSYQEIGSKYIENLTYGVEKSRDAAIEAMEKQVQAETDAYIKKIDDETEALVSARQSQIKKIQDTEIKAKTDAQKKQAKAEKEAKKEALQKEIERIKADATEKKKAYQDAAKQVTSGYKSTLTEGFRDALDEVKTQTDAMTSEFQKAHDDIVKQQDSMRAKLEDTGDLFSLDKDGKSQLSIKNINKNIEAMKRYQEVLMELKEKGAPSEILSKITAMNTEEGTKFAEQLAKMNKRQFEEIVQGVEQYQQMAKEISSEFYADQLNTLDNSFNDKLTDLLNKVPDTMGEIGMEGVQSWAKSTLTELGGASQDVQALAAKMLMPFGAASEDEQVKGGGAEVVGAFAGSITNSLPMAVQAAQGIVTAVQNTLGKLSIGSNKDGAAADGEQTTNAYVDGITGQLSQVANSAQETVKTFNNTIEESLPSVDKAGNEIVYTLANAIDKRQGPIRERADKTVRSFCDTINARYGDFKQTGLYAMQGLESGIREGGESAIDAASWVADKIISEMQRAADIHSPSRKTRDLVGKPIAQGIAVGFEKEMAEVSRRIDNAMQSEMLQMSAGVRIQAEHQAAQTAPQPIQTVYKTSVIEKTPVIEFRGNLAAVGRVLEPHIRVETRRRGGSLIKGE